MFRGNGRFHVRFLGHPGPRLDEERDKRIARSSHARTKSPHPLSSVTTPDFVSQFHETLEGCSKRLSPPPAPSTIAASPHLFHLAPSSDSIPPLHRLPDGQPHPGSVPSEESAQPIRMTFQKLRPPRLESLKSLEGFKSNVSRGNPMIHLLQRLWHEETAQDLTEYALLLALIVLGQSPARELSRRQSTTSFPTPPPASAMPAARSFRLRLS